MMKIILLSAMWIAVIAFLFTQMVLPLFTKLRFFWWFLPPLQQLKDPKPKVEPEAEHHIASLDELEKKAEEKTQGYKEVMDDIHGVESMVGKIKRKTDLNN